MNANNKRKRPPLSVYRLANSHPRFHLRSDKVYDWHKGRILEARELVDLLNEQHNFIVSVSEYEL